MKLDQNEPLAPIGQKNEEYIPPPEEIAMHEVFDDWLSRHTNDLLTALPYDPQKYVFQRINVPDYGPVSPSIEDIRRYGGGVIGEAAFDRFVNDLKSYHGLIERLKTRRKRGENNLIATPHLKNVMDTPVVQAVLFCAENDEAMAEDNVLILGKLISRISVGGEFAAIDALAKMGRVVMGVTGESAIEHGMTDEVIEAANAPMRRALIGAFRHKPGKDGKNMHWALSGTVAKSLPDDPNTFRMPPPYSEAMGMVNRYFSEALAVVVRISLTHDETEWEISGPENNPVSTPKEVHALMGKMANTANRLFAKEGVKIIYGE